jgi:hypothetical protein
MIDRHISSPRPIWDEDEKNCSAGKDVIVIGTSTAGIVLKVTKDGLELNGYYEGFSTKNKLSLLREFATISWDNLEKIKQQLLVSTKKGGPDYITDNSKEYLDSLPVVTLNGRRFYIDMKKRIRMPVDAPAQVFEMDKVLR